ncbi:hypothetical protein CSC2_21630 [Clostridium zeae]|uniref:DUF4190 domain-containing protein n=1 Tax=Clostridium zeae TaxID=2759022 RepID=A0ABQ1EA16_9CLOT|nr:hypothetical protein [Clostridium zeae]GFZ31637.1 hypothetical protein CSC2_21630 [Clostridium zeae]
MKSILYKNPLISTITINILTMILYIYFINQRITSLYFTIAIPGIIVGRIRQNGYNLDSKKRLLIFLSFATSICVITIYGFYITQVRLNQILGKT